MGSSSASSARRSSSTSTLDPGLTLSVAERRLLELMPLFLFGEQVSAHASEDLLREVVLDGHEEEMSQMYSAGERRLVKQLLLSPSQQLLDHRPAAVHSRLCAVFLRVVVAVNVYAQRLRFVDSPKKQNALEVWSAHPATKDMLRKAAADISALRQRTEDGAGGAASEDFANETNGFVAKVYAKAGDENESGYSELLHQCLLTVQVPVLVPGQHEGRSPSNGESGRGRAPGPEAHAGAVPRTRPQRTIVQKKLESGVITAESIQSEDHELEPNKAFSGGVAGSVVPQESQDGADAGTEPPGYPRKRSIMGYHFVPKHDADRARACRRVRNQVRKKYRLGELQNLELKNILAGAAENLKVEGSRVVYEAETGANEQEVVELAPGKIQLKDWESDHFKCWMACRQAVTHERRQEINPDWGGRGGSESAERINGDVEDRTGRKFSEELFLAAYNDPVDILAVISKAASKAKGWRGGLTIPQIATIALATQVTSSGLLYQVLTGEARPPASESSAMRRVIRLAATEKRRKQIFFLTKGYFVEFFADWGSEQERAIQRQKEKIWAEEGKKHKSGAAIEYPYDGRVWRYVPDDVDVVLREPEQNNQAGEASPLWYNIEDAFAPFLVVPSHLQEFALGQLDSWVRSAIVALFDFRLDKHYTIEDDLIKPVDFAATGVVQGNTVWSDGLHQFLQIKHGLALKPEGWTTNFLSNVGYMRRYQKENIFGLTGTLGGVNTERKLLETIYGTETVEIAPTYERQLFEYPAIVVNGSASTSARKTTTTVTWLKTIVRATLTEVARKRAVLVIAPDIKTAHLLFALLQSARSRSGALTMRVMKYTSSADESAARAIRKLRSRDVVVATNLAGRGTHIDLVGVERFGGLHVIQTSLALSSRVEMQAAGRTARQGRKGSWQLIVQKENQYDATALLRRDRDAREEARIVTFEQNEARKLLVKDQLFSHFEHQLDTITIALGKKIDLLKEEVAKFAALQEMDDLKTGKWRLSAQFNFSDLQKRISKDFFPRAQGADGGPFVPVGVAHLMRNVSRGVFEALNKSQTRYLAGANETHKRAARQGAEYHWAIWLKQLSYEKDRRLMDLVKSAVAALPGAAGVSSSASSPPDNEQNRIEHVPEQQASAGDAPSYDDHSSSYDRTTVEKAYWENVGTTVGDLTKEDGRTGVWIPKPQITAAKLVSHVRKAKDIGRNVRSALDKATRSHQAAAKSKAQAGSSGAPSSFPQPRRPRGIKAASGAGLKLFALVRRKVEECLAEFAGKWKQLTDEVEASSPGDAKVEIVVKGYGLLKANPLFQVRLAKDWLNAASSSFTGAVASSSSAEASTSTSSASSAGGVLTGGPLVRGSSPLHQYSGQQLRNLVNSAKGTFLLRSVERKNRVEDGGVGGGLILAAGLYQSFWRRAFFAGTSNGLIASFAVPAEDDAPAPPDADQQHSRVHHDEQQQQPSSSPPATTFQFFANKLLALQDLNMAMYKVREVLVNIDQQFVAMRSDGSLLLSSQEALPELGAGGKNGRAPSRSTTGTKGMKQGGDLRLQRARPSGGPGDHTMKIAAPVVFGQPLQQRVSFDLSASEEKGKAEATFLSRGAEDLIRRQTVLREYAGALSRAERIFRAHLRTMTLSSFQKDKAFRTVTRVPRVFYSAEDDPPLPSNVPEATLAHWKSLPLRVNGLSAFFRSPGRSVATTADAPSFWSLAFQDLTWLRRGKLNVVHDQIDLVLDELSHLMRSQARPRDHAASQPELQHLLCSTSECSAHEMGMVPAARCSSSTSPSGTGTGPSQDDQEPARAAAANHTQRPPSVVLDIGGGPCGGFKKLEQLNAWLSNWVQYSNLDVFELQPLEEHVRAAAGPGELEELRFTTQKEKGLREWEADVDHGLASTSSQDSHVHHADAPMALDSRLCENEHHRAHNGHERKDTKTFFEECVYAQDLYTAPRGERRGTGEHQNEETQEVAPGRVYSLKSWVPQQKFARTVGGKIFLHYNEEGARNELFPFWGRNTNLKLNVVLSSLDAHKIQTPGEGLFPDSVSRGGRDTHSDSSSGTWAAADRHRYPPLAAKSLTSFGGLPFLRELADIDQKNTEERHSLRRNVGGFSIELVLSGEELSRVADWVCGRALRAGAEGGIGANNDGSFGAPSEHGVSNWGKRRNRKHADLKFAKEYLRHLIELKVRETDAFADQALALVDSPASTLNAAGARVRGLMSIGRWLLDASYNWSPEASGDDVDQQAWKRALQAPQQSPAELHTEADHATPETLVDGAPEAALPFFGKVLESPRSSPQKLFPLPVSATMDEEIQIAQRLMQDGKTSAAGAEELLELLLDAAETSSIPRPKLLTAAQLAVAKSMKLLMNALEQLQAGRTSSPSSDRTHPRGLWRAERVQEKKNIREILKDVLRVPFALHRNNRQKWLLDTWLKELRDKIHLDEAGDPRESATGHADDQALYKVRWDVANVGLAADLVQFCEDTQREFLLSDLLRAKWKAEKTALEEYDVRERLRQSALEGRAKMTTRTRRTGGNGGYQPSGGHGAQNDDTGRSAAARNIENTREGIKQDLTNLKKWLQEQIAPGPAAFGAVNGARDGSQNSRAAILNDQWSYDRQLDAAPSWPVKRQRLLEKVEPPALRPLLARFFYFESLLPGVMEAEADLERQHSAAVRYTGAGIFVLGSVGATAIALRIAGRQRCEGWRAPEQAGSTIGNWE
eukprot:g15507.t1